MFASGLLLSGVALYLLHPKALLVGLVVLGVALMSKAAI